MFNVPVNYQNLGLFLDKLIVIYSFGVIKLVVWGFTVGTAINEYASQVLGFSQMRANNFL